MYQTQRGESADVIGQADTDHVEAQKRAIVLAVKEEELGSGFRSDHTDTQLP